MDTRSNGIDANSASGRYRDIIANALEEHSRLTTRQENEPDSDISDLYTDNKQLKALRNADWQLLNGRRGTGKTTLLNKLANVIDEQPGQASLTISLQKCYVQLPNNTSPRVRGLVQFEKFVMEVGYLFYRIYLNRTAAKNKNKKITRLLNKMRNQDRGIQEAILNIATFAHRGTVYGALNDTRTTGTRSEESVVKSGFGAKADVSVLKGAAEFSAFVDAQIQTRMKEMRNTEYSETAYIDLPALKKDFTDLLDALKIDRFDYFD